MMSAASIDPQVRSKSKHSASDVYFHMEARCAVCASHSEDDATTASQLVSYVS